MRIICPIDLGEASLNAINFAANIIQKTNGSLTLLHLEPGLPAMETEDFATDEMLETKAEAVAQIENICKETEKSFGISCDALVRKAEMDDIVKIATKKEYDLLVMGTDGTSDLEDYLFGSNTSNIMEDCDIPILSVPSDYYDTAQKHIVYASEHKKGEKASIMQLVEYAQYVGARVTVLYVAHGSIVEDVNLIKDFRTSISNQFGTSVDVKFKQVKGSGVEEALKEYLRKKDVDLLAMLTYHHNFFYNLFHESLSKKMTLLAQLPVMVFHQ